MKLFNHAAAVLVSLGLLIGCSDSDLNYDGDPSKLSIVSERLRADNRCTHSAAPPNSKTHLCGDPVTHEYQLSWEDLVLRTNERRNHRTTTHWCEAHYDPDWVKTERDRMRNILYAGRVGLELKLLDVQGSVVRIH
jgi:hypothetical protein